MVKGLLRSCAGEAPKPHSQVFENLPTPTDYLEALCSTRADPEGSPVAVRRVNVTVLASVSSPFHEIGAGAVLWLPPPPLL
jgi:hypothetical protein